MKHNTDNTKNTLYYPFKSTTMLLCDLQHCVGWNIASMNSCGSRGTMSRAGGCHVVAGAELENDV